ncbi:MAG: hypothetical protein AAFW70_24590 [Cyanobacteria bacterium J06635_10]
MTRTRDAAKSVVLGKELDESYFEIVLGGCDGRVDALRIVNKSLQTTSALIELFQSVSKNNLDRGYYWFGFFQFLREGLDNGYRDNLEPMVLRDKNNYKVALTSEKLKRTPNHRLPPQLYEVITLLEPYRNHFEYRNKPSKGNLEVLAWVLESYREAYDYLNRVTYWEPNIVVKNLPLALAPSWGSLLNWIEENVPIQT